MRPDGNLSEHDQREFDSFKEAIAEGNCLSCGDPDAEYVNGSACAECWVAELIEMAQQRDVWQQAVGPAQAFWPDARREGFKARRRAREVIAEQ